MKYCSHNSYHLQPNHENGSANKEVLSFLGFGAPISSPAIDGFLGASGVGFLRSLGARSRNATKI